VCYVHMEHFQPFEFGLCSISIIVDGPSSTKKDHDAKHAATCVSDADAVKRLSGISSAG